jgi:hypothetical protein
VSPQGLFNCLSPSAASPANGLPDFKNCQLRVSTNNSAATADQVFLNLQLPEPVAPAAQLECSLTGTLGIKPALSDIPPKRPKAPKVKGATQVGTNAGGSCQDFGVPPGATKYPVTAGSVKAKGALPVGSNCSTLSTLPLAGTMLKVKWQGINPKKLTLTTAGKSVAIVSTVTAVGTDGYEVVAPVVAGAFTGRNVALTLRTDVTHATRLATCQAGGVPTIDFTGVRGASTLAIT